jgi:hypothetical protein
MNSEEKEIYSIYSDWRNQRRDFLFQLIFVAILLVAFVALSVSTKGIVGTIMFANFLFLLLIVSLFFLLFIKDTHAAYIDMLGSYDQSLKVIKEIKENIVNGLYRLVFWFILLKSVFMVEMFVLITRSTPSLFIDPRFIFLVFYIVGEVFVFFNIYRTL